MRKYTLFLFVLDRNHLIIIISNFDHKIFVSFAHSHYGFTTALLPWWKVSRSETFRWPPQKLQCNPVWATTFRAKRTGAGNQTGIYRCHINHQSSICWLCWRCGWNSGASSSWHVVTGWRKFRTNRTCKKERRQPNWNSWRVQVSWSEHLNTVSRQIVQFVLVHISLCVVPSKTKTKGSLNLTE